MWTPASHCLCKGKWGRTPTLSPCVWKQLFFMSTLWVWGFEGFFGGLFFPLTKWIGHRDDLNSMYTTEDKQNRYPPLPPRAVADCFSIPLLSLSGSPAGAHLSISLAGRGLWSSTVHFTEGVKGPPSQTWQHIAERQHSHHLDVGQKVDQHHIPSERKATRGIWNAQYQALLLLQA